ncbi:hypothetical protein AN963_20970 [Brevibacillus choshinensis]|uniref:Uncharacterized protein n=1 Tax=Brevibacillus choshinensis TaxID=54911 RepID=A0ABR5N096_BRECH|nr:hypothetical protein AN963_20970 [Brevibacillus choshinensis]
MTFSRGPKKLEHFLLFPLLHRSLTDHVPKGAGALLAFFLSRTAGKDKRAPVSTENLSKFSDRELL